MIDAPAATPSTVLITIEGAPKGTQVLRNGAPLGLTPKVEMTYGTKEVPLLLQAANHEPEQVIVIPDADKSISVTLTKKSTRPRPNPTNQQQQQQEDATDTLEDPFATPKKRKSGD